MKSKKIMLAKKANQFPMPAVKVPKKIHLIWVGSMLPIHYQEHLFGWASRNPDYDIFWYYASDLLSKEELQQVKKFGRCYDNLYKKDIHSIPYVTDSDNYFDIKEELRGSDANESAASDELRHLILYNEGGMHLDTDIQPKLPSSGTVRGFGQIELQHEVACLWVLTADPKTQSGQVISANSCILIAVKGAALLKEILSQSCRNYRVLRKSLVRWYEHRSNAPVNSTNRFFSTMHDLGGPGIYLDVLKRKYKQSYREVKQGKTPFSPSLPERVLDEVIVMNDGTWCSKSTDFDYYANSRFFLRHLWLSKIEAFMPRLPTWLHKSLFDLGRMLIFTDNLYIEKEFIVWYECYKQLINSNECYKKFIDNLFSPHAFLNAFDRYACYLRGLKKYREVKYIFSFKEAMCAKLWGAHRSAGDLAKQLLHECCYIIISLPITDAAEIVNCWIHTRRTALKQANICEDFLNKNVLVPLDDAMTEHQLRIGNRNTITLLLIDMLKVACTFEEKRRLAEWYDQVIDPTQPLEQLMKLYEQVTNFAMSKGRVNPYDFADQCHEPWQHGNRVLYDALLYDDVVSRMSLLSIKQTYNETNYFGEAAIHLASRKNILSFIKNLHKLNADLTKKNYLGETALSIAVRLGHVAVCEFLLEAEPALYHEKCFGQTLQELATDPEIIDVLQCHDNKISSVELPYHTWL